MRAFFYSLLSYFLTPGGIILMAALDSTLIFFLPLGIDFAVVILAAREPGLFWMYALLATLGSVAGAGATFWIGRKLGEKGLSLFVKPARLKRIEQQVSRGAGLSVGLLAVIPPPFPFTAFVLTSGALRAHAWTFMATLAAARLVRFGVEAGLAALYGRRILLWMQSTVFEVIVAALIALALVGTVISAIAVWRGTRRGSGGTGRPLPRPVSNPEA